MDAQLVWNTWRRLLTTDPLVEWATHPEHEGDVLGSFSADQIAVLADYASTPVATEVNVGMYRRGLVRNTTVALDLVPLTRRLVQTSEVGVETLAADFIRASGYLDHGPRFWFTAERFIRHLRRHPEFTAATKRDVLILDATTARLARLLGESTVRRWPDEVAASAGRFEPSSDSRRFTTHKAAALVTSAHDLTSWIENPFGFDPADPLDPDRGYWLVYFPRRDGAHEYAKLSERAARVFEVLATPKTVAETSEQLDGVAHEDVSALMESLGSLGVVVEAASVIDLTTDQGTAPSVAGSNPSVAPAAVP